MPTAKLMREAIEDAEIKGIAIVDDGYDTPDYNVVYSSKEGYEKLRIISREIIGDDAELKDKNPTIFGLIYELPDLSDLEDSENEPLIQGLWKFYTEKYVAKEQITNPADRVLDALNDIFGIYKAKKEQKLTQLSHLENLITESFGQPPDKLPSQVSAETLARYDLIFLDFFLDDAIPARREDFSELELSALDSARKKSNDLVVETIRARGGQPIPLFVLISTIADPEKAPDFRDDAGVLASKFRFLPKQEFQNDKLRTIFVISELLSQRKRSDSLEHFINTWEKSINKASKRLISSVKRLDVSDYAYVERYRLKDEKINILSYIIGMYNNLLGSFVEEDFPRKEAADLISKLKLEDIPSTHFGPSGEVADIYSRITTTNLPAVDHLDSPVWAGDLFVRRNFLDKLAKQSDTPVAAKAEQKETKDEKKAAADDTIQVSEAKEVINPDILAVVTPSCDLVPERVKVRTVTLISGKLSSLGAVEKPSSHLLVMDNNKYQVDWDSKYPVSFHYSRFKDNKIDGTDYIKVSRLRALYHLELQNLITGDLAGVGVPVTPPISFSVDCKILAKPAKGDLIEVVHVKPDMGMVWGMFSSRKNDARTFVFDEGFLWFLRRKLSERFPGDSKPPKCLSLIDDLGFLRALQKPLEIKGSPIDLPGFSNRVILKRVGDFVERKKDKEGQCELLFLFLDVNQ